MQELEVDEVTLFQGQVVLFLKQMNSLGDLTSVSGLQRRWD